MKIFDYGLRRVFLCPRHGVEVRLMSRAVKNRPEPSSGQCRGLLRSPGRERLSLQNHPLTTARLMRRGLALACVAAGLTFSSPTFSGSPLSEPGPSGPAPVDESRAAFLTTAGRIGFKWDVIPPIPEIETDPESGFTTFSLPGYASPERPSGQPDLPRKVFRVAVPFGAKVALTYSVEGVTRIPGSIPRPHPTLVQDPNRISDDRLDRTIPAAPQEPLRLFRTEDAVYRGAHPFPRQPVRLGEFGVLRNQRFVEVIVEPLCFRPDSQVMERLERISIELEFSGGESLSDQPPIPDRFFESVYRDAFVNSDQAPTFRRRPAADFRLAVSTTTRGAGLPRVRLRVRADGLRRLDFATLSGFGFAGTPIDQLSLTNRGIPIPVVEEGNGDGQLQSGEALLFYGQRLDDEIPSILNYDIPNSSLDIYQANDFSDENIYFLEATGQQQLPLEELDGTPTFVRVPPADFQNRIRAEVDDAYRPLGGEDSWYWLPTMSFNFNSPLRMDPVALPGLADGLLPAQFEVKLRGVSDDIDTSPDHGTRVTVRNDLGEVVAVDQIEFEGRNVATHFFATTGAASMSASIEVQTEVLTGLWNRNDVILDYIDVTYRRNFTAVDGALAFEWPDEDSEFVVDGFENAAISVYERISPVGSSVQSLRRIQGAVVSGVGPASIRFRVDNDPGVPDGTVRRFLVADSGAPQIQPTVDIEPDTVSDLRQTSQQADLILIAHPDLLDLGPGRAVDQWIQHRQSPAGGGLTVKVAMIQDVEDEFNDGLVGPTAIRNFLAWVLSAEAGEGWADPKPSFVLLVGDASFNYKGGTSTGIYVPTQMMFYDQLELGYHASDSDLAAVLGSDGVPDLMIGRFPVRSQSNADLLFQKTLDYETMAPAGDWKNSVLLISDRGKFLSDGVTPNPNETAEFEIVNDSAASFLADQPFGVTHLRYLSEYYEQGSNPWNAIRADIKAAVNGTDGLADGRAIVQFIGHGNFQVWSDDAFWDERPPVSLQDTRHLINGNRLPILLAQNCLTGGFHACPTGDCSVDTFNLAEQWLLRPGGGSVASFSPTGLSFTYVGSAASDSLWNSLFGDSQERSLAAPLLNAYIALCAENRRACQYYSLLGDPALQLQLPSVGPATSLVAIGANMSVELSWNASSTPGASYDVYRRRTDFAFFDYERANGAPVVGTTFTDSGLVNTVPYQYYVVARSAEGFRSAISNSNLDCPVGPECVMATPLNPNPPSVPTLTTLEDPGIGDSIRVRWLPNPEIDLSGYEVLWGTTSGIYTDSRSAAAATTQLLINGLQTGTTYYFALKASNTSGLRSAASAELDDFPVNAPGLRPPAYISDLFVTRQGSDLVLSWSEVTEDSYGKPLQAARYEILRGTSADFSNAGSSVLASCLAPCSSWTHVNAAITATSFHYRVRAVDAMDVGGALGSQYPDGTSLVVEPSPTVAGDLRLSWTPVTIRLDGQPITDVRYLLFRSTSPFSILDILQSAVLPAATVNATTIELTPGVGAEYYSVLAVDSRGNRSPF